MNLVLVLLLQGAVESPRKAFERAEALYREQDYAAAAEVYEAMRAQGFEDGVLYYNLGNAYFKAGRLGVAVLSYERSLALMPGDEDVRTNLAYANELIAGDVEPAPLPLVIRWVVDLYRLVRPNVLAVLLSISFLLGGIALTIVLHDAWPKWRTPALAAMAVSVVLALLSGGVLAAKLNARAKRVEAIVLTENAYVRSGPGESNPRLAEIHEGLKVRIVGERDGWYQVTLANGLTGWMRLGEVEKI